MDELPLPLSYATPPPRPRWRREIAAVLTQPVSDRRLGVCQLAIGLATLAVVLLAFALRFSDGRWTARLAWFWVNTGDAMLNAVAALVAFRGATRPPKARRQWYAGYALVCLAGLALAPAAVAVLDRWPPYVSYNPLAPAVNDHRYQPDIELYWRLPMMLLVFNPLLILIVIRGVFWLLARVVGPRRSPLDVECVRVDPPLTRDVTVSFAREGRDRG